ncbi:hypothetical protein DL93DRAFT_2094262 [Clavulina sp. PMI_390]|nr:hypothetical protein DL93DRAFT_2094262 [Clavulina sp. PMI_390]
MASTAAPLLASASDSSPTAFTIFEISREALSVENFMLSSTSSAATLSYEVETPPPAYSTSRSPSTVTLLYRTVGDDRKRVATLSWLYPEVLMRYQEGEAGETEEKAYLSDVLPQEAFPSKILWTNDGTRKRTVKLADGRVWVWSFSTKQLELLDSVTKAPLARYDPAPIASKSAPAPPPEAKFSASSSLSLEDLDLVIVGFISMLHDARVRGDLRKLDKVPLKGNLAQRTASRAFTSLFGSLWTANI